MPSTLRLPALTLATPLLASTPLPADPVPIEPAVIIDQMTAVYRAEPTAERVTIAVKDRGLARTESFDLFINPPNNITIQMGDLTVWSDRSAIHAVNTLNATAVHSTSLQSRTIPTALAAALPPIPAPSINLALAKDNTFTSPTPYTQSVTWTSATADDEPDPRIPPTITLKGANDTAALSAVIDLRTNRLRRLTITPPAPAPTITITAEPIDRETNRPITPTLAGRARVASLTDLTPKPGDITPGRKLPQLTLSTAASLAAGQDSGPISIKPPAILLLMREWTPGNKDQPATHPTNDQGAPAPSSLSPADALLAARQAQRATNANLYVALTFDMGQRADLFDEFQPIDRAIGDTPLLYSLAPTRTIDRFAPTSPAVLITADATSTVRTVIPIDNTLTLTRGQLTTQLRDSLTNPTQPR